MSAPREGDSTISLLASARNLPERLKSLRITSATSVGSGAPPFCANGTTAIGVAVFRPPTMSTLSDCAPAGPATSAARHSTAKAKSVFSLRMDDSLRPEGKRKFALENALETLVGQGLGSQHGILDRPLAGIVVGTTGIDLGAHHVAAGQLHDVHDTRNIRHVIRT